jgi:hypothetical protein
VAGKTRGSWKPGQSGNPAGRKPGSGKIGKLRAQIEKDIPGIIAALVQNAKAGDAQAGKLLLDRVLPALKPVDEPVRLPLGEEDLTASSRNVLEAIAAGTVTPQQGLTVLAGVTAAARVEEIAELRAELRRLTEMVEGLHVGEA